jgi:metal-responsive CopG/Arc/MetJ family transcriptional regulator
MTDKITISVLLDPKVYDQVKELQKQTGIFSRSALLRKVIDVGLKEVSKNA